MGNKTKKQYINLGNLEVYILSVELSEEAWKIYSNLDWENKKIMGHQFIEAVDSIGANIAEGYGRFHYKDRIKFYYNARGSLLEAKYWLYQLFKRKIIENKTFQSMLEELEMLNKKLNSYIKACYPK